MNEKIKKKSLRIAILGSAFFLLGAAFFAFDFFGKKEPTKFPSTSASKAAPISIEALKGYPDPKIFQRFTFGAASIGGILDFNGVCKDKYVAFLIFPKDFDYRIDPARASYNRAIECPSSGKFQYALNFSEFKGLVAGEYYAFAADEPVGGLWYNPR